MLDLARLRRLRLHRVPAGQVLIARLGLQLDYHFPRPTEIVLDGVERIPADRGVFFAMNHTDRFNYWPFQYQMYRQGLRFTATWVKGKYYENALMALFMDYTNNIPLPSRGYVLTTEFRKAMKRRPSNAEYRALRDYADKKTPDAPASVEQFISRWGAGQFHERFAALFCEMTQEVIRLNRQAFDKHELNVLVFPQGTRSKRLTAGHTGLAQMAQYLGVPIIPVGCNGCDKLYPGNLPSSRGGRVVYRFGEPIDPSSAELSDLRVEGVMPLSDECAGYDAQYRGLTDLMMKRINDLLDPEYQFKDGVAEEQGVDRFI